ncbi:MAG: HAD hydrolase-like protein [Magnetococcales bacterium]|nr:HAD hydrolase-like protein [Magnetococcales bacterium]
MSKPPVPDHGCLEKHIVHYRQMVCGHSVALDERVRRGTMQRVAFSDIVRRYSWIWFDAYGVLNRGTEPVPGAGETLRQLRRAGIPFRLVSNNASHAPEEIRANLAAMGIVLDLDDIVTSGQVVGDHVRELGYDTMPYLWVGAHDSARHYAPNPHALMVNHLGSTWREDAAEFVLFSGNQEYYGGVQERILLASGRVRSLPLLLVNADLVAPEPSGETHLVAGFTACTASAAGRHPLVGVGKPFRPVFDLAWKRCGYPPLDRVLMVGDALETDILGAAAFGVGTCLTLTGLYGPMAAILERVCFRMGIHPDYVVGSIAWEA